jgi:putative glutamine amidotransferase
MTGSQPRIAIPEPTSTDEAYNHRSLPQYVRAVEAAGGIAVPIRLHDSAESQASLFANCSGVLLPGSPADVDPERYAQKAIQETAAKDVPREDVDNLLLDMAFQQGKPVLGICFGLQSLNVWRKGTLIQDLRQAHLAGTPVVNHEPGREVQEAHGVRLAPGSRLARLLPNGAQDLDGLKVNSSHHQAIDQPGQHLRVVATSTEDGVIEALEGDDAHHFVVAVQWHPERSYEQSAASRALFEAFLGEARAWKAERDSAGATTS